MGILEILAKADETKNKHVRMGPEEPPPVGGVTFTRPSHAANPENSLETEPARRRWSAARCPDKVCRRMLVTRTPAPRAPATRTSWPDTGFLGTFRKKPDCDGKRCRTRGFPASDWTTQFEPEQRWGRGQRWWEGGGANGGEGGGAKLLVC